MEDRKRNYETIFGKSAHRVRSLVCETNKFWGRGQFLVPASKANGRPFALLAERIFRHLVSGKPEKNGCGEKADGV